MATALIILNYNNAADSRNCVASVIEHNTAPVKFIVVDNGSDAPERDAIVSVMTHMFPKGFDTVTHHTLAGNTLGHATLLLLEANKGYARGNNAALELAYADPETDHVMILNNDIIFVEDIIPQLVSRCDSTPRCGIISPMLYCRDMKGIDYNCARRNITVSRLIRRNLTHYLQRAIPAMRADDSRFLILKQRQHQSLPTMLPIELPSGSCMLVRKEVFREIGSFDPSTFLYFEENILFMRTQRAGLRNYLCPDLRCIHLGASTMQAMPRSMVVVKASIDSERYYVSRYSGAPLWQRALHRLSSHIFEATIRLQKTLKDRRADNRQ